MQYANRENRADLLHEETVAHMLELWHHGAITDEEVAPVGDTLDDIGSGRLAGNERAGPSEAPDAALAARRRAIDFIAKQIAAGKGVPISLNVAQTQLDAAKPYLSSLPEGASIGAIISVRPIDAETLGRAPGANVVLSLRVSDGRDLDVPINLRILKQSRAFYHRPTKSIVLTGLGRADVSEQFVNVIASRTKHEIVHAHWRGLDIGVRNRLASHSHLLGVLDMQLGTPYA